MTLAELIKQLQEFGDEYADFPVVVPTGMDCAEVQRVELVVYDSVTGATRGIRGSRITVASKRIVFLISASNEPRE